MSFTLAVGTCFGCGNIFSFHPIKVCSLYSPCGAHRVNEPTCADCARQPRVPLCLNCVKAANPQRIAAGLAPFETLPGAYEAADAADLAT